MGILDAVALLVIGYNVFRGLNSGLVRSLLSLLALAAASFMSWQYPSLGAFLGERLPHPLLAQLAGPLFVWVATFVPITLAGILLGRLIRFTPLALLDRLGGALLGLSSGLVFVLFPLLLIAGFPLLQQIPSVQQALAHSFVAAALGPLCQRLLGLFCATIGAR